MSARALAWAAEYARIWATHGACLHDDGRIRCAHRACIRHAADMAAHWAEIAASLGAVELARQNRRAA